MPPLTEAWSACHEGALKKLLVPPPVTQLPPKMKHSFRFLRGKARGRALLLVRLALAQRIHP
jgi:hypothetical protein